MKKTALWVLVPLCILLILACPNPASTGGGGGGGNGTTTIISEGSLANPVVLGYTSFRECQIDADSPSWYQFTILEAYTLRIRIDGITPALESGEFLDVFLSDDKDNLPSVPTFVVTNSNMGTFHDFSFEAGTHYIKILPWPGKALRFAITMAMGSTGGDDGGGEEDDDDPVTGVSEGSEASPVALSLGKYRLGSVGTSTPSYYSLDVPLDGVSYYIKLYDISPTPAGDSDVFIDAYYTEAGSDTREELFFSAFPRDNTASAHYFSSAGTLDIRVNEGDDHARTFKFVVSAYDYSDLSQYPEEGDGMGTYEDPWVIQVDSPRTIGTVSSSSYRYLAFDADAAGADYTLKFELVDGELGGSGLIDSDANAMQHDFSLEEETTELSFSAIGADTRIELHNVDGNVRVTLSEAETIGRWAPMGTLGFSTGGVIEKHLAANPATGELWAVCREQRGTTSSNIVLAVYRAGDDNASWTEVTGLPDMTAPALPTIAVDSQGKVYVGYNEDFGASRYMALIQYDGSSWSNVGSPAAIQYGTDPQNITLLVDGDDVLHALWSSGEGQGFKLEYFTWDGTTLAEEAFYEDIYGYNFAAVLNSLGNVTLGVSWSTPFYHWTSGSYDYATGNFVETDGGTDYNTPDRGTVWMAAASDGTPWAIVRDTIGVDEHQYRLRKLGASGWESVYDFPAYNTGSQLEFIEGLAISGSAPAILSTQNWSYSVWGYDQSGTTRELLGERWLAYDTLREGELFAGKDGELYVIGITSTNEVDPSDGKLSVYTWEQ